MGRSFDGSYAEYTLVPAGQVIPFDTDLPWDHRRGVAEMFQTAYGSITTGLDLQPGQTLLIRGGTSTVGLSATALAEQLGARVIATTRNPDHVPPLLHAGAEHAIADDGALRAAVREFAPDGVDAALELVGTTTLPDTLTTVRKGGIVCFTGALAGGWIIQSFSPFIIPTGVQLTSYAGEASDLPAEVFAAQLEAIKNGSLTVSVARVYHGLDQVREAHRISRLGARPAHTSPFSTDELRQSVRALCVHSTQVK